MSELKNSVTDDAPIRIPLATCRVQFTSNFRLAQAAAIVPYLHELGISDCYASPLLTARAGSTHGYDIIDHSRLNPELGGKEEFALFAGFLREFRMGLIMDVVPNHMCIATTGNQWWNDVLENGPGSLFNRFFDIDWEPPKNDLRGKVLLPMLGEQYGRVLENQELQLSYQRGVFAIGYYETKLPIAPRSAIPILEALLKMLPSTTEDDHPHRLELESIITALNYLPSSSETDPEKIREKLREKEVIKRRLSTLISASQENQRALKKVIREFNGYKNNPHSFDRLEELLAQQPYRLSFWRVASDEINYRRFFDVNELAAIRVEEPEVFAATHELILRLMREGLITGLRIDHVDGLLDPQGYLSHLQQEACQALQYYASGLSGASKKSERCPEDSQQRYCYIVVEKILGCDEHLREDWAVYGTTGYDALNLLNSVFVEGRNEGAFRLLYQRLIGNSTDFEDVIYQSKKLIFQIAMSSELQVLARRLDRISEQHRYSRDFTFNSLHAALGEVIACFPVYRSYVQRNRNEMDETDRRPIDLAIHRAKRRNPTVSPSIYDFIKSLLLREDPEGLDAEQRIERQDFVLRLQQLTGPLMAKGLEDTAFYRYYPLASLNEVGGELSRFGISLEQFHQENEYRQKHWPHTMIATSTHDTKRSEDLRARINVLSEIPAQWYRAVRRWQNLNRERKPLIEDQPVPDANEEYLLYQTLIGAWPFEFRDEDERNNFVERIQQYLTKVLREAKIHSSWINPNDEYEQAVYKFVADILSSESPFMPGFIAFQQPIARAGIFNSLSQTLLKMTIPGVPDFYQGTELWDFSLVDPDNRRPVDYERRKQALQSLKGNENRGREALIRELLQNPHDGRLKMFLTSCVLNYRRSHPDLFASGHYQALSAKGIKDKHLIAFARRHQAHTVLIATSRYFTGLQLTDALSISPEIWGDTILTLDAEFEGCYRDVLTEKNICLRANGESGELPVAEIFTALPFALLEKIRH